MKALGAHVADLLRGPHLLRAAVLAFAVTLAFLAGYHWHDASPRLVFFSSSASSSPAAGSSSRSPAVALSPNSNISFDPSLIPATSTAPPASPTPNAWPPPSLPPPPLLPPPPPPPARLGIVGEDGAMRDDFDMGSVGANDTDLVTDETAPQEPGDAGGDSVVPRARIGKVPVCPESMPEYIPCLDNQEEIKRLPSTERGERFERHCPANDKALSCLVPAPKGYKAPIPWPRSRDEMVPDVAFGSHTRVVLDVGCGVASFGAYLLSRDVLTLSIAPKDVHENQIQFALERDGILLLEVNRLLRAGGYFAWAAQPVYKHEEAQQEAWKDMEDLTARLCWELVKKEGYIAMWRKPLNNSCYMNRDPAVKPPLCDTDDNPDDVWYVNLKACISRLPEIGEGLTPVQWPARLMDPPKRLQGVIMDAYLSKDVLFKAETKFWDDILEGYIRIFKWRKFKLRNVMDMRAGFGGFAAALINQKFDCWVMNVVPVTEPNTLPVIYDRGLLGVAHDWCEPFDTYPRTYDLLHASGLFSKEQKRCNISSILLEMDRILRPGGRAYIRDRREVIQEIKEITNAMGWRSTIRDTSEGKYASRKVLMCDKPMVH
nr:unnamed protein product [Digitaria exilis]